jgi:hypothetical protein
VLAPLFMGLAESGVLAPAAVVVLLSAFLVLRADLGRRRLPVRPTALFALALLAGLLGA